MARVVFSDARRAALHERYKAGASMRALAQEEGVSQDTLTRLARSDGWRLRPPPPGVLAAAAARARKRAAAQHGVDRAALAAKLRAAVEAELAAADRALGSGGSRGDVERAARTLASLVRTLNELRRLDAGIGAGETDASYSDLDTLRRELARRLAGLGGERAG